jgi:hypothetical protein
MFTSALLVAVLFPSQVYVLVDSTACSPAVAVNACAPAAEGRVFLLLDTPHRPLLAVARQVAANVLHRMAHRRAMRMERRVERWAVRRADGGYTMRWFTPDDPSIRPTWVVVPNDPAESALYGTACSPSR